MENSRSLSKSQWNSNVGVSKLRTVVLQGGGVQCKKTSSLLQKKIVVFNMWVKFFLEKPNRLIMLKH